MKFVLNFSMDNLAFDEGAAPAEVARLLRAVADEIESAGDVPRQFQTLRDVNGNRIGQWAAKPDDYTPGSAY